LLSRIVPRTTQVYCFQPVNILSLLGAQAAIVTVPADWGIDRGIQVQTLLAENAVAVPAKSKHSMLPLLIVLFLISYGLLAMLVVEQGRTIDAQRTLINQLFSDSVELTSLKGKNYLAAHPKSKNQPRSHSQAQTPSTQIQTPSSQDVPRDNKVSQRKGSKFQKQVPQKPPQVEADSPDDRRSKSLI
jgi:hypothetical protein